MIYQIKVLDSQDVDLGLHSFTMGFPVRFFTSLIKPMAQQSIQ